MFELSPERVDQTLETVDALIAEAFSAGRIEMAEAAQLSLALGTLQAAYDRLRYIEEELG